MYTKRDDVTSWKANSIGLPPDQNVNKAVELTYLSTNILLEDIHENFCLHTLAGNSVINNIRYTNFYGCNIGKGLFS